MGILEQKSRARRRKANLQRVVLGSIAGAGILSVALLAPNALSMLRTLGIEPGRRSKESLRRTRDQLFRQGLLTYEGKFLKLTSKGEARLRHLLLSEFASRKPRKWDGRWRILIFDIPEHKRGLRDRIRRTLRMIGFSRLQNSVWMYPYDCEDLITLLKADFKIGKDLLYMIVESLENDSSYRRRFDLKGKN